MFNTFFGVPIHPGDAANAQPPALPLKVLGPKQKAWIEIWLKPAAAGAAAVARADESKAAAHRQATQEEPL